jgi:uncharacterized membrane protein YeaQ/YmgE (transglycosylase-associated protein family)
MTDRHAVALTGPHSVLTAGIGDATAKGTHPMGIIAWIVVGAIAGFIATFIMGNREGILMTIVLGIVGAVVGGFLAGAFLNLKEPTGINVETIVVAVIGAIVVVFVANLLMGTGRGRGTV